MPFTTAILNNSLKNALIKAVDEGYENILNKQKGKKFNCMELQCALAIGNALEGFVPETTVVSGTQATITFTTVSLGVTITTFTLTATGEYPVSYSLSVTGSNTAIATLIVNFINSQSTIYVASANGAIVTITGTHYDEDNGTVFAGGNADDSLVVNETMAGGVEAVYQDNNCITDEEAQQILAVLNKIISPCEPLDEDLIETAAG